MLWAVICMKLDGNAICYLLSRKFDDVVGHLPHRDPTVDYPLLYDESDDMGGHTVLVPEGVLLDELSGRHDVVYVCLGEESARSAVDAGLSVVHVRDDVTMQHLYNSMQSEHVVHERLDAQLRAYVDTYAGFSSLLEACARAMGCSCALIDKRFRVIAQAGAHDAQSGEDASWIEGLIDEGDIDLLMASRDYRRMRATRRVFMLPSMPDLFAKNIFAGNEMVGLLVIPHEGTVQSSRYTRFLLEYLSPFVEQMYARLGSFDLASEEATRIRTALGRAFAGALDDYPALDQMLSERFERDGMGRGSAREFVVLCFERSFTNEGEDGLEYLARRVELAWPHAFGIIVDSVLFALVGLPERARGGSVHLLQGLAHFAREALVKVGMSRPFTSCANLMAARMQSSAALEQGKVEAPTFWFYRFDDYALAWLVSHGRGSSPSTYVAHPALSALVRYDDQHESDLVETLRTFMECRYNATEAAARLFVARSTLLNRLDRIKEITAIDLDDFKERIYLGISLELLT